MDRFGDRLRSWFLKAIIPLIYGGYLWILWQNGQFPGIAIDKDFSWLQLLFLAGLFIGLALWLTSYLYLPPTSHFFPKADRLVTKGPYRFVRHPVYTGISLVLICLSLLNQAFLAFWYALAVIVPINLGRAVWEEKVLSEVFPEEHRLYRQQTWI